MPQLDDPAFRDLVAILRGPVLHIAIIVVLAAVAMRAVTAFVHGVVKQLLDREAAEGTAQELSAVEIEKRIETIGGFGSAVVRAFVVLIAAVMVLRELNLDVGPAVAGLGVVGIAVGFGAQSLVRDYFGGALILVENQFSKGDVISIAGVSGVVEDFSLRRTTLRDLDGVVHTVPNGEIKVASNRTRIWSRINIDVTVAYGTDIDRATEVVDGVGATMLADPDWHRRVLEAPHVERVEALGEYGVTLKVLGTVRATEQWAASGELRKRLLAAFAANDIRIPTPQRVVLARDPNLDPFQPGGKSSGPSQDELEAGSE
jgi:moderate conductance mechanosensitive channel